MSNLDDIDRLPGRIDGAIDRPRSVTIDVDGRLVRAHPGERLAAALLAAGIRGWRRAEDGSLRGPFCFMGVCQDCLVYVEGRPVQACMLAVMEGMVVQLERES